MRRITRMRTGAVRQRAPQRQTEASITKAVGNSKSAWRQESLTFDTDVGKHGITIPKRLRPFDAHPCAATCSISRSDATRLAWYLHRLGCTRKPDDSSFES